MGIERRRFLRGDFAAARKALRPPWALHEAAFLRRCTRCDACIQICPTNLILRGSGGYPEVDFSHGECTFCADCSKACTAGALNRGGPAWFLRAGISSACLAHDKVVCRSCGDACGARAIRFASIPGGAAVPHLSTDTCTGCGACVRACPADAIAMQHRLAPAHMRESLSWTFPA
jgi:ferredoxin-type protein NapF